MKTAIIVGISVGATLVTIAVIKNVHVADTVPVLGAGLMKVRSLL